MSELVWEDRFSVGVDAFDNDHKVMMGLINQLDVMSKAGLGPEALEPVFRVLLDYVERHFRSEEELMAAHDYPDLARHRAEHRRLREGVETLHREYVEAENPGLMLDLVAFLESWWQVHILREDMAYKPFFAERLAEDEPVG